MFHVPNRFRIETGASLLGSTNDAGNNGAFFIPGPCGRILGIIASDGEGWEHVSVSTPKHIPTWKEMCFIKNLFWDEEDTVIQYHPPKSEYVNNCKTCLHLWRPVDKKIPLPPSILVGFKKG